MTPITAPIMTAEGLARLPRGRARYELIRGELKTMPPAGFEHGAVGVNLAAPLAAHVKANRLGVVLNADTGFVLERDPDTVRAPDVGFVRQDRIPATGLPKEFWPGAPDLAVEVISPSDTLYEVEEKVAQWLEAGTRLVWVVNPRRRSVSVYTAPTSVTILSGEDVLDGQDVVPGFRCAVRELFVFG